MTVEFLGDGAWVPFPNATEQHIESNRYLVTVGTCRWLRSYL